MPPADSELHQAAETLRKVVDFVGARRGWSADAAALHAMASMRTACDRCATAVDAISVGAGGRSTPPATAAATPLPAGTLDATRLGRFAGWLGELAAWLEARRSHDVGPEGAVHLAALAGDLESLRGLLDQRPGASAAAQEQAELSPPAPPPRRPKEPEPEPLDVPAGPPLVLVNSFESPLLREVGGQFELAARTRSRLRGFLEAHHVDTESHNLRRLEIKLTRWLEATPEGQALVLKVGGLHGRREPYPSYVSKERAEELETGVGAADG